MSTKSGILWQKKKNDSILRSELLRILKGGGAHVDFEQAIAKIPKKYYGAPVEGIPYTLWRILNHMRISQRDILEYILNPSYQEKIWPNDYWPKDSAPSNDKEWSECANQIRTDLNMLMKLVEDPKINLLESIPHIKDGPPIIREILLAADHNSYHIGQIVLINLSFGFI